jgi:hypothetical protein
MPVEHYDVAHAAAHHQLARTLDRMADRSRRMFAIAVGLGVLVALNGTLTLYDVWLRLGGRWPWQ